MVAAWAVSLSASGAGCGDGDPSGGGGASSCDPSEPCPLHEHCVYPDQQCGKGRRGTCAKGPLDCDITPFPPLACSCSGFVAPKACVDVGNDWTDPATCSKATFACGDTDCREFVEYCEARTIAKGIRAFECKPTPVACVYGVADCTCVDLGGGQCDATDDHVTVTIPLL